VDNDLAEGTSSGRSFHVRVFTLIFARFRKKIMNRFWEEILLTVGGRVVVQGPIGQISVVIWCVSSNFYLLFKFL